MSTPYPRTRRAIATVLGLVVLLFGGGAGIAPAHAQDTAAVAINTKDGTSVFRLMFQIRKVMSDAVTTSNAAVAYASCTECEAIAVSMQIVLAGGDPDVVSPENLAIAVNQDCSSCVAAAYAYQFVIAQDGKLRFTPDGNRRLADVRKRLQELRRAELTPEELQRELDAIADDIRDVLANELVTKDDDEDDDRDDDEERDDASPSPTATASPDAGTAETTGGASPSPTTSASPTASPSPSASASPSPSPVVSP